MELNERVKVRIMPSNIHGVGLFAIRGLKEGEKLYLDNVPKVYTLRYADFGKLDKVVKELLLERWPQILNGSNFAYPDGRYSAYCNHSDTPNVDMMNDVALRDILSGEELTEDYRLILNFLKVFPWLDNEKGVIQ